MAKPKMNLSIQIALTQGKVAIIDAQDAHRVLRLKWCATRIRSQWYVISGSRIGKTIYLHRFIMQAPTGIEVDHRNCNGLDDRRCNLRLATSTQNKRNSSIRSDNTSGFKGVSWYRTYKKWKAYIRAQGRQKTLGYFDTALQAAKVYDAAAINYFGDFAKTNEY
jgi:hypothetical protein